MTVLISQPIAQAEKNYCVRNKVFGIKDIGYDLYIAWVVWWRYSIIKQELCGEGAYE